MFRYDLADKFPKGCFACPFIDDGDGASAEFSTGPIWLCTEYPGRENLKSFPFQEAKCFGVSKDKRHE
jgi:hypothetical protein